MYKDILLAIDLNDEYSWRKAAPVAVAMAQSMSAALHVMTVVPDFGSNIVASFFPDGFEKQTIDKANEVLHEWTKEHIPGDINVQHIVGHGKTHTEILRIVKQTGCDLIVLGARNPENRTFGLGSNSYHLVREAAESVMIVRG